MFQLYDRTRRRITLALFFVLCLAPTLAVAGWCFFLRLPAHVRSEARCLGWQLGMKVSLEDVHYPRPDIVRYEGLVLFDPETGGRVLSCRAVEARWTTADPDASPLSAKTAADRGDGSKDSGAKSARPLLVVTALEPAEVEAAALGEVGRLVERVLARRSGCPDADLRLQVHQVRVRSDTGPLVLIELDGRVSAAVTQESPGRPGTAEAVAELAFRPSDAGPGEKATIRVTRVRALSPPADGPDPVTEFVLDTGSTPLPCSLLAANMEGLSLLGPKSRFSGSIRAAQRPEGWSYRLQGRFSAVDLGRLFANRFPPHRLSGLAQVTVKHALFAEGRLHEFRGEVQARDGTVTRSLIDSAARSLGLVSGLQAGDLDEFRYDQLAAELALDARGLQVQGLLDRAAIVCDQVGTILSGTPQKPIPVPHLVQVLVPGADPAGGSTSAAERLARRLPIPGVLSSAGSSPIIPVAAQPRGDDARR